MAIVKASVRGLPIERLVANPGIDLADTEDFSLATSGDFNLVIDDNSLMGFSRDLRLMHWAPRSVHSIRREPDGVPANG